MRNIGILAVAASVAAVAGWTGVFMYASWISAQLDTLKSQAADLQSVSARDIASIKTHALARDTKDFRDQLDGITHSDVIGIADTLESVGRIAGVTLNIGSAAQELEKKKSTDSTAALHAVSFVVEAAGTFSSVMHAAALLENLPLVSSVQDMEFENVAALSGSGSAKSTAWHVTARIRVVTTADI